MPSENPHAKSLSFCFTDIYCNSNIEFFDVIVDIFLITPINIRINLGNDIAVGPNPAGLMRILANDTNYAN